MYFCRHNVAYLIYCNQYSRRKNHWILKNISWIKNSLKYYWNEEFAKNMITLCLIIAAGVLSNGTISILNERKTAVFYLWKAIQDLPEILLVGYTSHPNSGNIFHILIFAFDTALTSAMSNSTKHHYEFVPHWF